MAPKMRRGSKGGGSSDRRSAASQKPETFKQDGVTFERSNDDLSPFWDPTKDETHPNPLIGAFMGERTIPARGKFKEQKVIEVVAESGSFAVALKGNLPRKFTKKKPVEGQIVYVEHLRFIEPSDELPMGMHDFDFAVEKK